MLVRVRWLLLCAVMTDGRHTNQRAKEKYNNLKEVVSNKAEALILVERDLQEAQDEKDTQQRAWEREQKDLKKLNEQLRLYEANDVNCV